MLRIITFFLKPLFFLLTALYIDGFDFHQIRFVKVENYSIFFENYSMNHQILTHLFLLKSWDYLWISFFWSEFERADPQNTVKSTSIPESVEHTKHLFINNDWPKQKIIYVNILFVGLNIMVIHVIMVTHQNKKGAWKKKGNFFFLSSRKKKASGVEHKWNDLYFKKKKNLLAYIYEPNKSDLVFFCFFSNVSY